METLKNTEINFGPQNYHISNRAKICQLVLTADWTLQKKKPSKFEHRSLETEAHREENKEVCDL